MTLTDHACYAEPQPHCCNHAGLAGQIASGLATLGLKKGGETITEAAAQQAAACTSSALDLGPLCTAECACMCARLILWHCMLRTVVHSILA